VEGILSRQACSALAYSMRSVSGIFFFLKKNLKCLFQKLGSCVTESLSDLPAAVS
jgi:hypothetical protein